MGWMTASYTVDKFVPEKPKQETQVCTDWREETGEDGRIVRTRTCEPKK
jgi:hypothetical protein